MSNHAIGDPNRSHLFKSCKLGAQTETSIMNMFATAGYAFRQMIVIRIDDSELFCPRLIRLCVILIHLCTAG